MATMELSAFRKHYEVNTIGPLVLYQAFRELLLRSPTQAPKFIGISTAAASIGSPMPQIYAAAYQSSKASLNFLITRIGIEDEKHGMVSIAFGIKFQRLFCALCRHYDPLRSRESSSNALPM
jgi:NAD(P)-dependent dehydrogenase (short-subunit alcohol dehydrogenase family)